MTTPTVATCSACRVVRPLAELLRVSETGGLHRSKFVCRPNVDPRCFASIGPRSGETITTALPEEPLLPHYRPERPALAPRPVVRHYIGRLVATDATGNGGPW